MLEQAHGGTCAPVGDPWWSSLFLKDCTPWEGTHTGAGEESEESSHSGGRRGRDNM